MTAPIQFVDIRRVPLRTRMARRVRAIGRSIFTYLQGLCS